MSENDADILPSPMPVRKSEKLSSQEPTPVNRGNPTPNGERQKPDSVEQLLDFMKEYRRMDRKRNDATLKTTHPNTAADIPANSRWNQHEYGGHSGDTKVCSKPCIDHTQWLIEFSTCVAEAVHLMGRTPLPRTYHRMRLSR